MKQLYLFLAIFILVSLISTAKAQPNSFNCQITDSVKDSSILDAQRLALRWIEASNSSYFDSVEISAQYTDTILNALAAIHHNYNLPEIDTVERKLNIGSRSYPALYTIFLSVDTSYAWAENFKNKIFPSGNYLLDSLFTRYGFYIYHVSVQPNSKIAQIVIRSGTNLNLAPLIEAMKDIDGVWTAAPGTDDELNGPGDIFVKISDSAVYLTYLYQWDCSPVLSCSNKRYWRFKVSFDCSVEVDSVWGDNPDTTFSQSKNFVCPAPDSVKAKYVHEAQRLAVKWLAWTKTAYNDSVNIQHALTDTMLNALTAIHQVVNLPERDTVVDMLKINTIPWPVMRSTLLYADTNYAWVKKLINNEIPTMNDTIDDLMARYNLKIKKVAPHVTGVEIYVIELLADTNLNLSALYNFLRSVAGVKQVTYGSEIYKGGFTDIKSSIHSDAVFLTYIYEWDCHPPECFKKRVWRFKVNFDCSVEVDSVWGDNLDTTFSQSKNFVCPAPDSVKAKYVHEAQRLAVKWLAWTKTAYNDSVNIQHELTDTMLNALTAIHQAVNLPERDTVVDLLKINTIPWPVMRSTLLYADTNYAWVKKLINNEIPTMNDTIDDLMARYNLKIKRVAPHITGVETYVIELLADTNLNLSALFNLFRSVSGVEQVTYGFEIYKGGFTDIKSSIFQDGVYLTYYYGWNCHLTECFKERFWRFKVSFDCSVEVDSVWGDNLDTTISSIKEKKVVEFNIYPNPAKDWQIIKLNLEKSMTIHLQLIDMQGRLIKNVHKGMAPVGESTYNLNIAGVAGGMYLYRITLGNETFFKKVVLH